MRRKITRHYTHIDFRLNEMNGSGHDIHRAHEIKVPRVLHILKIKIYLYDSLKFYNIICI